MALFAVSVFAIGVGSSASDAGAQPILPDCNGLQGTVYLAQGQQPTNGDDIIIGTPGDDQIAAGGGSDIVCGLGGNDSIWGQGGRDLILGGDGDDKIRGGDDDDVLVGGEGSDDINGGRDNDVVLGQGGADSKLRGGTGDDYVSGGDGDDPLLSGNGGADVVAGGEGNDALSGGPRKDELFGGAGNDVLRGLSGADRMFGDAGNDELRGGEQPDLLDGGIGTDVCNGGAKDDRAMNCETSEVIETQIPAAIDYTTRTTATCPFDTMGAPQVSCHLVSVPEDDTDPANGRKVELMVAYIDNGDPQGIGPILDLAGGPGGSNLGNAPFIAGAPVDVVLVDQRGIGDSRPSLDCTEVDAIFGEIQGLSGQAAAALDAGAHQSCLDRLNAAGVNLGAFNTEQNADDFNLVRQAMGFTEWNVTGVSYGTRLGLTIARDHPEGVRALIVDAVLPIEADAFGSLDPNYFAALDHLVASCASHAPCTSAYGDLDAQLQAAFTNLNNNPQTVVVTRDNGEQIDVVVNGSSFIFGYVFNLMYVTEFIPEIPRWIAQAAQLDVEEVVQLQTPRADPQLQVFSEGMFRTVMCQDEELFLTFGSVNGFVEACPGWVDYTTDQFADKTPATGTVPTLVMSGSFDPITPAYWGRQVADSMSNATFAEFTTQGHGSVGPCASSLFLGFLSSPGSALDTSCANLGTPNFSTGSSSVRPLERSAASMTWFDHLRQPSNPVPSSILLGLDLQYGGE